MKKYTLESLILIGGLLITGCALYGEHHSFDLPSGRYGSYFLRHPENKGSRIDVWSGDVYVEDASSDALKGALITAKERGYQCVQILEQYSDVRRDFNNYYAEYFINVQAYPERCTTVQRYGRYDVDTPYNLLRPELSNGR
jgi:hypothetical protein